MIGPDPSVVEWELVMAPRPRAGLVGRHWWRETVMDTWRAASDAWHEELETVAVGYPAEQARFKAEHPAPTLQGVMRGLSQGRRPPASWHHRMRG